MDKNAEDAKKNWIESKPIRCMVSLSGQEVEDIIFTYPMISEIHKKMIDVHEFMPLSFFT